MIDSIVSLQQQGEIDRLLQNASPEALREALQRAVDIIAMYQMDIRSNDWLEMMQEPGDTGEVQTLAELGFCQGRIYENAMGRVIHILSRKRNNANL